MPDPDDEELTVLTIRSLPSVMLLAGYSYTLVKTPLITCSVNLSAGTITVWAFPPLPVVIVVVVVLLIRSQTKLLSVY